jgi:hypothetical protein
MMPARHSWSPMIDESEDQEDPLDELLLLERIARDGKIELHPDGWSARSDLETMPDRHVTAFKRFLSRFYAERTVKPKPQPPPEPEPDEHPIHSVGFQNIVGRRVIVKNNEMYEEFRAGRPYVWINEDGTVVMMGKQPDPTWRRV